MRKLIQFFIILFACIGLFLLYFQANRRAQLTLFPKTSLNIKSSGHLIVKNNFLYVEDGSNYSLKIFQINSDGNLSYSLSFGKSGIALGEFKGNLGLAVNDDYLFVGESMNHRIQILVINTDGSLSPKSIFGKKGVQLGEFNGFPIFNLAAKDGHVYAADSGNNRIQVLRINPDGSLSPQSAFGKEGNRLGEFGRFSDPMLNMPAPLNLMAKDDYLIVADSGNNRIQVLRVNADGSLSPKTAIGKKGNRLGEFQWPLGLAIKDDYLFVADSANHRIQVLRIHSNGRLSPQFAFGKKGKALGEFGNYLTALSVVGNYLYVSDPGNDRIQVLEIKY